MTHQLNIHSPEDRSDTAAASPSLVKRLGHVTGQNKVAACCHGDFGC